MRVAPPLAAELDTRSKADRSVIIKNVDCPFCALQVGRCCAIDRDLTVSMEDHSRRLLVH